MTIAERRELIARVIDVVFVTRGRGPAEQRVMICPAGTAPRNLSYPGDKVATMRSIKPRRGWINPKPPADRPWATPDRPSGHLQRLSAALVAPPGELRYDPDKGKVQCHLCGRWFVMIGSAHLYRTHRITAHEYRRITGLDPSHRLSTPNYCARRSAIQHRIMAANRRL